MRPGQRASERAIFGMAISAVGSSRMTPSRATQRKNPRKLDNSWRPCAAWREHALVIATNRMHSDVEPVLAG